MKKIAFMAATLLLLAVLGGCAVQNAPAASTAPAAPVETPAASVAPTAAPTTEPSAPAAALPKEYEEVIAQYAEASATNFYGDADDPTTKMGEFVATELAVNPQNVYYAVADINADGVAELLIAADDDADDPDLYDIITIANGKAVRLFPDLQFGGRASLDLYADGTILIEWSDSAFESGDDVYKLNGTAAEKVSSFTITSDEKDKNKMIYKQDGKEITEEQYDEAVDAYETAGDFTASWTQIGE